MSGTSSFQIRDAVTADAPVVVKLAARAFKTAAPEWARSLADEATWLTWVDRYFKAPLPGQFVLVAEANVGEILGIAHVMPFTDPFAAEPHPHLETIAVAPLAEGRGIASGLIEACAERVRQVGAHELTLHVYVGNTRAQSVYERLGFAQEWIKMRRPLD